MAVETGQDLKRIGFKDQSWIGLKTRSRKFFEIYNIGGGAPIRLFFICLK
jgi:hypothetical protein